MYWAANLLLLVYAAAATLLMLYGLNCYVVIALFHRKRKSAERRRQRLSECFPNLPNRTDLPVVTTQIPLFNEVNVAERVLLAESRMHYPAGKHQIQVLDDSTDETREAVDRMVRQLKRSGVDISVIRRVDRIGFKAGALANGLTAARGDLIAIFDADFVPPKDYLLRTVPHFLADAGVGLVQARWGHLNRRHSVLTRAQSIGIDGHFMIEQAARTWNGLYMNFNGTAGIWRRAAIEDGGGWHWDTLIEDMDLSYRVQLAGWRTEFLPDLMVPAGIPEDIRAFKGQQFRWAKGSIQTAKKLLPQVLRAPIPAFQKIQAVFHMTHYLVHPLMLALGLLALPVLLWVDLSFSRWVFTLIGIFLLAAMAAPSSLYVVSQRAAYPNWRRRILILPALVTVGVGIALSNTRAVVEAVMGRDSDFIRTPKRGHRTIKHYALKPPVMAVLEVFMGLYCAFALGVYLAAGKYLVGPFLLAYAGGFLFVGLLSMVHAAGWIE